MKGGTRNPSLSSKYLLFTNVQTRQFKFNSSAIEHEFDQAVREVMRVSPGMKLATKLLIQSGNNQVVFVFMGTGG